MKKGNTRLVFLVGSVAVKVPTPFSGARQLLFGLLANVLEAERWRDWSEHRDHLVPVRWCAPLGLLLVMDRTEPVDEMMSDEMLDRLPFLEVDKWPGNHDRRDRLLDYGNIRLRRK